MRPYHDVRHEQCERLDDSMQRCVLKLGLALQGCGGPTWVVDNDVVQVHHHIRHKPQEHDWCECESNLAGPKSLEGIQEHQDCACHAYNGACIGCAAISLGEGSWHKS